MISYQKLYFQLFARIEDAVRDLEAGDAAGALSRLIQAQRDAEEQILTLDIIPDSLEP